MLGVELRDVIVPALNSIVSFIVYTMSIFVITKTMVAITRAVEVPEEKVPVGVKLLAGEELRRALRKAKGKKILPVPLEEW